MMRALVAVAALGVALSVTTAGARPVARGSDEPISTWVPDEAVEAIARRGDTIYIGGWFRRLSPRSGHGAVFEPSTLRRREWPEIGGTVTASAPDGKGGFFLAEVTPAGDATQLVHRSAAGVANPRFAASVAGEVQALTLHRGRLYVGGTFTALSGRPRANAGAVNVKTGALLAWNPRVTSDVWAIAAAGTTVFLAVAPGEDNEGYVAALTETTARRRWDADLGVAPCTCLTEHPAYAAALLVSGRSLYVGGYFDNVNGVRRSSAAALDVRTGTVRRWRPRLGALSDGEPSVEAVAADRRRIYLAEQFLTGGQVLATDRSLGTIRWRARNVDAVSLALAGRKLVAGGYELRALDTGTGRRLAWSPSPNGTVHSFAVSGRNLFVGGGFTGLGGVARRYIAAIDANSGSPTAWNPGALSRVSALTVSGETLYVGADGVSALDATTGAPLPWHPRQDVRFVEAIAVAGATIFVAGRPGAPEPDRLFAFDATSGALIRAYAIEGGGRINALAASGDKLYVAGRFTAIDGALRGGLAAIDVASGEVGPWNPRVGGDSRPIVPEFTAVATAGGRVYVGRLDAGSADIVALSGRTGAELWRVPASIRRILLDEELQDYLEPRIADLAADGRAVYVAGVFEKIARADRMHAAAVAPDDGEVLPWNPTLGPRTTGAKYFDGAAELTLGGGEATVGGNFRTVGGLAQSHLARFAIGVPTG